MKGLLTLKKILERDIKEQRRVLKELENQLDRIAFNLQTIDQRIRIEIEQGIDLPEYQEGLTTFLEGMNLRKKYFRKQKEQLDKKYQEAQDVLRSLFADMKRYDIAYAHMEAKNRAHRLTQENHTQDDQTQVRHHWQAHQTLES